MAQAKQVLRVSSLPLCKPAAVSRQSCCLEIQNRSTMASHGDYALAVRRRAVIEVPGASLELVITQDQPQHDAWWEARIATTSVTASQGFSEPGDRVGELVEFFDELAASRRGWNGQRVWWISDRRFSATHDGLGHVVVWVTLGETRRRPYGGHVARPRAGLLRSGERERVAASAHQLLVDA